MNSPVNILLIDDEPRNLDVLESILDSPDYHLIRVQNADDALRELLAQEIAVLVLDIRMPGTSGLELAQMIKQRPATRHVPIIFLTAYYHEDEHVLLGYGAGAVDYLHKPCNPEILRSKVAVFVDLFRKSREVEAENARRRQVEEDLRQAYAAMEDRVRERTDELRRLSETLEQKVVEATAELRHKAEQLRMLAAELNRVKEHERKRLAQVLHDGLQQLLVAARMRVVSLMLDPEPGRLARVGEQVRNILDDAIQTSRSLTAELSPPILYDAGLVPALEWLSRWTEENYGLRVALTTDPDVEPSSEADRVLLFDAAREFLFNTVKHAGGIPAQLHLGRAPDGCLRLTVADDGPGFDPAAVLAGQAASGMGLMCLRERVELLGGALDVVSAPGGGARVTVSLPAPALAPSLLPLKSAYVLDATALPLPSSGDGAIRVLLADDHKVVRDGFKSVLTAQEGIDVVGEASDGEEAVDLARALQPDVVIMDVSMPRMNGVEATRRIVEMLPGVRVIGLSMHHGAEMGDAMRRAGAVAYLSKDGSTSALLTAIRAQFDAARAASAPPVAPGAQPPPPPAPPENLQRAQ